MGRKAGNRAKSRPPVSHQRAPLKSPKNPHILSTLPAPVSFAPSHQTSRSKCIFAYGQNCNTHDARHAGRCPTYIPVYRRIELLRAKFRKPRITHIRRFRSADNFRCVFRNLPASRETHQNPRESHYAEYGNKLNRRHYMRYRPIQTQGNRQKKPLRFGRRAIYGPRYYILGITGICWG